MYGYIYETMNLVTGEKYIGKHRSSEFNPSYYGTGTLIKKAVDEYGPENFEVRLLEEVHSLDESSERERYWIELYDAVRDPNYYNIMPGGQTVNILGLKYVRKKDKSRCTLVHPDNISLFLSDNPEWEIGGLHQEGLTKGRVFINNGEVQYMVHPDSELPKGWSYGRCNDSSVEGKIKINLNDEITKSVLPEEVQKYLSDGWSLGAKSQSDSHIRKRTESITGRIKMYHKDTYKLRSVHPHEVEKFLADGFIVGDSPNRSHDTLVGRVGVTRDGINKYVPKEELDDYLSSGWTRGRHITRTVALEYEGTITRVPLDDPSLPDLISKGYMKIKRSGNSSHYYLIESDKGEKLRIRVADLDKFSSHWRVIEEVNKKQ